MELDDRIHDIEKHLRTLNHELGDIVGQMKWVFRILVLITGLAIAQLLV
ncbi:hypothetical protein LCGC14_1094110 [marine sediment metagenome]|uniref:Uncharacterized protein n=1 Tax=marine sediment metagenome TaxID=412755 RepID=A0A0F9MBF7_9ZZZZ